MRKFNVTGTCVPEKHYMVDISGKLSQIDRKLQGKYTVLRMSFEGV